MCSLLVCRPDANLFPQTQTFKKIQVLSFACLFIFNLNLADVIELAVLN